MRHKWTVIMAFLILTSACVRGEVSEEQHDAFVKEMEMRRDMKERDRMIQGVR